MLNQFKPTNLIVIMGPTAGGKTLLAAHLAARLNSGVISADSRQVYKGMDIGTGKDLADYTVNGTVVPYYLIDIVEAGTKYNVYEYQKDFVKVFNQLLTIDKIPVLCGGSGLYIEAVLKGYRLISVPVNEPLRAELAEKDDDELIKLLQSCKKLHNRTDTSTKKRIIRAIEIEIYYSDHAQQEVDYPEIHPLLIAVSFDRKRQREKITERLHDRLNNGMIIITPKIKTVS